MPTGRTRARWRRWWPFGLLVLVGASRWMLSAARPETGSTLGSGALGCGWAALLLFLLPARGAGRAGLRGALDWRCLLAGVLLLGGPASALLAGGNELDAGSMTIALALTPVAVAIGAAALGGESADGVAGRIWPGLAAVAGLLLVLAQPRVGDAGSDLGMLLAPVLTGVGAALFCMDRSGEDALLQIPEPFHRARGALAGGAMLFMAAAAGRWLIVGGRPVVGLSATACDGLVALLSVIALLRLGATRWSAQFVILPLLILIEGIVLMRPVVTARWLAGLVLLVGASVYLLLPQVDEPEEGPAVVPR